MQIVIWCSECACLVLYKAYKRQLPERDNGTAERTRSLRELTKCRKPCAVYVHTYLHTEYRPMRLRTLPAYFALSHWVKVFVCFQPGHTPGLNSVNFYKEFFHPFSKTFSLYYVNITLLIHFLSKMSSVNSALEPGIYIDSIALVRNCLQVYTLWTPLITDCKLSLVF